MFSAYKSLILVACLHSTNVLAEICFSALDVVQVQDMTSSFDDLWLGMSKQVHRVADAVSNTHRNAFFAFSTFGDKPLSPFGYSTDYCYRVDVTLDRPDGDMLETLFVNYSDEAQGGGGDWSEGVFEAAYRAILAPQIEWRTPSKVTPTVGKLVVVVTDAMSHMEGDLVKEYPNDDNIHPTFDITRDDLINDENYGCATREYPGLAELARVANENNVSIMFLTAPGGYFDEDGDFKCYKPLATAGVKYRNFDGLSLWYKDMLANVGFNKVYVQMLDADMNGYAEAFEHGLQEYLNAECATTTTTTTTTTTSTTTPGTTIEAEKTDFPAGIISTTATTTTTTTSTTTTITSTTHHDPTDVVGLEPSSASTTTTWANESSSPVGTPDESTAPMVTGPSTLLESSTASIGMPPTEASTAPMATGGSTLPECTEGPSTLPQCTEEPALPECTEEPECGNGCGGANVKISINLN